MDAPTAAAEADTPTRDRNGLAELGALLSQLDITTDAAALNAALDGARGLIDVLQPETMGLVAGLLLQWPAQCDASARRERWCRTPSNLAPDLHTNPAPDPGPAAASSPTRPSCTAATCGTSYPSSRARSRYGWTRPTS